MDNIVEEIKEMIEELNEEELIEIKEVLDRISNNIPAIYPNLKIGDNVRCKLCKNEATIADTVTVLCGNCGEIDMSNSEEL